MRQEYVCIYCRETGFLFLGDACEIDVVVAVKQRMSSSMNASYFYDENALAACAVHCDFSLMRKCERLCARLESAHCV